MKTVPLLLTEFHLILKWSNMSYLLQMLPKWRYKISKKWSREGRGSPPFRKTESS